MRVDLISLGGAVAWAHGEVHTPPTTPAGLAEAMARVAAGRSEACACWDATLGAPTVDPGWLSRRADVVHAGLALGTGHLPVAIDYIQPTWMWNCNPPTAIEATSWRVSLRACLIRTDVIRQLGGVRPEFRTLDAAGLELGHRYLTRGAFVRHRPFAQGAAPAALPLFDELLFARLTYGDFWARWALWRGLLHGDLAIAEAADVVPAFRAPRPSVPTYQRELPRRREHDRRISVIVPTIERYSYLRTMLAQLAEQTVAPHEVIIIDQTPVEQREPRLAEEFASLPIRLHAQDTPGQCTARNRALELATGDSLLFLDDDDEIGPTLLEDHLASLATFDADVACGVSEEVGAGPVPVDQRFVRASDVLSTNNTMVTRQALLTSGLFDLAFDRKKCEDKDLGVRLYLAGAFAVLDPKMTVLHHHAPRGGLRVHGTRVVTRASSRSRIRDRNLPHMSETYLAMRYFSPRQVREAMFLRTWGTLRIKGGAWRQMLKLGYGLANMPDTLHAVRTATREGRALLAQYPQIASLSR